MHSTSLLFSLAHIPSGCAESHPDAALLALAPALEAAVQDYEAALPRAASVTLDDPDEPALDARARKDARTVRDMAQRILDRTPTTRDGLLLTAHAAAAATAEAWEPDEPLEDAEARLRTVCDAVFRLAGVDWRGQPLPDAAVLHPDAPLLALGREFDARVSTWLESIPAAQQADQAVKAVLQTRYPANARISLKAVEEVEAELGVTGVGRREENTYDAVTGLLNAIVEQRARTVEGLAVKARAVAILNWPWGSYEQDIEQEAKDAEDNFEKPQLRDLIESILALTGVDWRSRPRSGGSTAPSPIEQTDPVFAAIEASRAALAEHVAACNVPDADTPKGEARRTAAGEANVRAWAALKAARPRTAAGALALARYLPSFIKDGPWDDAADARALFGAIGAVGHAGPGCEGRWDPVFEAAEAHRIAYAAMLAARGPDRAAFDAAVERSDAVLLRLLRTRPTSDAGRLVYLTHALFEIVRSLADGTSPAQWTEEAGRMLNGGLPIRENTPPPVVQPIGAGALLKLVLNRHLYAYSERLDTLDDAPDAPAKAAAELEAFRALLGVPLVTDADRAAFATAVLERASGTFAEECWRRDADAPLVLAFRNLSYGEQGPVPAQAFPLAAE